MRRSARLKRTPEPCSTTQPVPHRVPHRVPVHVRAPAPPKSPFINLPPEIRNHIYNLLLISGQPLQPNVTSLFKSTESHEKSGAEFLTLPFEQVLAFARTCSQIHDEVISVYYGRNRFEFRDTYDLYVYLYMVGEERRQYIRDIKFTYHGPCARDAFGLLGECVVLKKLHVVVTWMTTTGSKNPQTDLWKCRGISALREIRDLKFLDVVVEQLPLRRYIPQPIGPSLSQEENFFDNGHVSEFQTLLQKEMRQESCRTEKELEKERKRIERKENEEKKHRMWRLQQQKEWQAFEEKEAKRLAELA